jgi:hypothetical protein
MLLKSRAGQGIDKMFAYLIEPQDPVKSDAELYAAVEKHGKAVISVLFHTMRDGKLTMEACDPQTLTPVQLEQTWKGA